MIEYEHGVGFQSEKKDNRVSVPHAIVPLTIRQVLSLTKEGEIELQPFQHIVLIGKLISSTLQGHKYKIIINDGTGEISLTSLTSGEKSKNSVISDNLQVKRGKYFFIVLTAKQSKENKEWTYFLDNIREITNFN